MHLIFDLSLFFIFSILDIIYANRICYRDVSGQRQEYCCDNFEPKGDICTACLIGYTSKGGSNCQPCNGETFGDKCAFRCSCTGTQMCNNVKGCVDTTNHSEKEDVTQIITTHQAESTQEETTTFRNVNTHIKEDHLDEVTIRIVSAGVTKDSLKEIFTYGIGILLVVVIIWMFIKLHSTRLRMTNSTNLRTHRENIAVSHINNDVEIPEIPVVHAYDEIDEDELSNHLVSVNHIDDNVATTEHILVIENNISGISVKDCSSSNESSFSDYEVPVNVLTEKYHCHQYLRVLPDFETHEYCSSQENLLQNMVKSNTSIEAEETTTSYISKLKGNAINDSSNDTVKYMKIVQEADSGSETEYIMSYSEPFEEIQSKKDVAENENSQYIDMLASTQT